MKWPDPNSRTYDVILTRNVLGDIVQMDAHFDLITGSIFDVDMSERSVRPNTYNTKFRFRNRNQFVNELEQQNFRRISIETAIEPFLTSSLAFAGASPLENEVDDAPRSSQDEEKGDIVYDQIEICNIYPAEAFIYSGVFAKPNIRPLEGEVLFF